MDNDENDEAIPEDFKDQVLDMAADIYTFLASLSYKYNRSIQFVGALAVRMGVTVNGVFMGEEYVDSIPEQLKKDFEEMLPHVRNDIAQLEREYINNAKDQLN